MTDTTTPALPVLSASVDWITATTRPGLADLFLLTACQQWLAHQEKAGWQARQWGFQGYTGQTIEGLSFGRRTDSIIVRLSGTMAAKHAPTVLRLAANVSRIDLQVTVQDSELARNWHDIVRDQAYLDPRCKSGQTSITHIERLPDGASCYIGSRSSDRYFRVYDKHAESQKAFPPGSWRWEIEYKRGRATRVAEYLMKSQCSPETCRFIVQQGFQNYGVTMPTEPLTRKWSDAGIRYDTTDERRLQWLETSIAPMIGRLLESTDRQTIIDKLGLGDLNPIPSLTRAYINGATGEIGKPEEEVYEPVGWYSVEV